ncbi:dipeptide epimerase [Oceanispirochaeta crateris]|uniref:Dipeptide epimerase n=1 Tax=Oceanispirochaeta crateris TaxID=2518645 RepID=A0A5C1QRH6_9SPIO|nr:dipeptide epimerase [Oceanispirochaeta crateris]QEN08682.1 dipeptide epimerase [Oceanispirochaeta crateris]
MKIDSVEVYKLDMDLVEPYEVAYSRFEKAENILIRVSSGILDGWGCAAPDPHVTGEYADVIFKKAQEEIPFLMNKDPFRRAVLVNDLKKRTPGLFSLWAALDMALWDLIGKKADLPVWKILGGYRKRIKTSITVGICGIEETMEKAQEFIDSGFSILKIKGGQDVQLDIERISFIRRKFDSRIQIRFDANQGYSIEETKEFMEKSAPLDIELLEQPTNKARPEDLGVVSKNSSMPIMADESLVSLLDAFHLVKRGLIDLMNIKIMKVGGLSEAIQIDAVARAAGVEVMVGCMDESAIGIAAGLHFALSRKNIRYADLDGHIGLISDPAKDCVILDKGWLYPSSLPGFGWKGL